MSDDGGYVQHLINSGVPVWEEDQVITHSEETGLEYFACILAKPRPGGHSYNIALRPGLSAEEQADACRAAAERFVRISEFGPEPDGWQLRSDGDYQLWLRMHDFGEAGLL